MQTKVHNKIVHRFGIIILIAVLAGLLNACKSYHLGSPAEIPFKSIYIKPVSNQSYAPQAQAIVSAMLRENFMRDSRIEVVADQTNADAILLVTLTNYERNSTARRAQDTVIADVFDIQLAADVSLMNPKTRTYLFENRPVEVTTNAYTKNPYDDNSVTAYQLSERQAMELLARDLAHKVTEMTLNPW